MKNYNYCLSGHEINIITLDTVIIGSGCAGFNAADTLYDLGITDIAIVTEGIKMGTSRNTGSDKQTYYKLTLSSDCHDSIYELAENLFNSGGVNGDTALVEAACSVRCFMKLVNLGVPFPTNAYGEYVGYKTDHDPRQRATSCGPLTSKLMTQQLEKSVFQKNIKIYDNMQAVKLLVKDNAVIGLVAIDLNRVSENDIGLTLFNVKNIIMATGGPAGVYYTSVYPKSQTGMTGIAIEAGAKMCNLQEWQYGLASIKFRWNVSGTYQQVLPRYISIDKNGNEKEFLPNYFHTPQKALDMIFLKGYQWPFDVKKLDGSSIIDVIVHNEIFNKGNRVYMDFTKDPIGLSENFSGLSDETYNYLKRSNALIETPVKRLERMNPKAIELYVSNGIDLYTQPLEVSVCAQHNNGGIAVDINWQSSISGLYAAGEVAGTFGVYRPGGSALNSTQVGSLRAAEHIAYSPDKGISSVDRFITDASEQIDNLIENINTLMNDDTNVTLILNQREYTQKLMSKYSAQLRNIVEMENMLNFFTEHYNNYFQNTKLKTTKDIAYALKTRDIILTQIVVLDAQIKAGKQMGSRGSALIADNNAFSALENLSETAYIKGIANSKNEMVATSFVKGMVSSELEKVRPLPHTDDWFEITWKKFNSKKSRGQNV